MKHHISKIASTCFYHLRRLRQLRDKVSQETMKQLVTSLVLSRIDYCNVVLAGLPASTIAPLQRVQNAAALLVLRLDRRPHITPALRELHWLPVKYRIEFKVAVFMHQVITQRCPSYVADLVAFCASDPQRRSLRSASTCAAVIRRTRTELGRRAFAVCGPDVWNSLPPSLRTTTSHSAFRRSLKTHIYNLAFLS